jgi:hypothetical protein
MSAELIRQVFSLPPDAKKMLLIWLQEDLDGGPYVGDTPEPPDQPAGEVKTAWAAEIARRIEDMRTDRVERIDAMGAAARLLRKMRRKYAP